MGAHMKTTVEIADALFEAAKRHANERGTTIRALVEEGLRSVLESAPGADEFKLPDKSMGGRGIRADVREGGWDRIAELVYEGHGG